MLIKIDKPEEGVLFNRWLYSRLIKANKNVLCATTGPTGSGKSYQDLRRAELWYKFHFKKKFPQDHICFSVAEVMVLLNSKTLKKGDIINAILTGDIDIFKIIKYELLSNHKMENYGDVLKNEKLRRRIFERA